MHSILIKSLLALVLIGCGVGGYKESNPNWLYPTPNDADRGIRPGGRHYSQTVSDSIQWRTYTPCLFHSLKTMGKPVVLFFDGKMCLTCHAEEALWSGNKVAQYARDHDITFVRVRIDDKEFAKLKQELMKQYDRSAVPFYVFLGKNGKSFVVDHIGTQNSMIDNLKRLVE